MTNHAEQDYDVIVAGGGAGGVGAALGAARAGAKVCLVEKYGFLGGAATHSQVLAYCGFFQQGPEPIRAVAGAGDIVLNEIKKAGIDVDPFRSPTAGNWLILIEPEAVKLALDRALQNYNIDVYLHSRVTESTRNDGVLTALKIESIGESKILLGNAFVDATGDAQLSRISGISCRSGNENGLLNAASAPIRIGGLAPDLKIDHNSIIKALENYNLQGKHQVTRRDAGFYTRLPVSGDLWWSIIDLPLKDLSVKAFSDAEREMRSAAHDYVCVLKQSVKGFKNAYLVQTGPQIGIRESYHPEARYILTGDDLTSGKLCKDGIARAAWPAELHTEVGKPKYHSIAGQGYAHIPLGCLQSKDIRNLYYAGRLIGADDLAYGSIRVMGTAFATGEAAGVAAANQTLNGSEVAEKLTAIGAII